MTDRARRSVVGAGGFTLIELLVVVAIIALLISILLPALSSARSQARTTLCLSRIGQMGKGLLLYADDYGEVFPFISTMHGTVYDANEAWLAEPNDLLAIHHSRQEVWPEYVSVPRSGWLFTYCRFEDNYRCPEFERVSHPDKAHSVWNYTRAVWARLWRLPDEFEAETGLDCPSTWGDVSGPIMKVSKVYAPGRLPVLLDEQWDRHVATAGCYGDNGSAYNCNDYGFFADNIIGIYHGRPTTCRFHKLDYDTEFGFYDPFLWKRGSIFCYDGHADLERDPWPTYESGNNTRLKSKPKEFRMNGDGGRAWHEMNAVIAYMDNLYYAQRGRYTQPGEIPPFGS
ncbi:MAG: prepilin-type N-terminal cleavage/methylation domain-containing protein [Phycisphaerae bacterium]|nr:prepilin-type N-terminal cleavage/methylation domain-containing protein [Phycisphaerae bacterium]